jgi:hypothetical protein
MSNITQKLKIQNKHVLVGQKQIESRKYKSMTSRMLWQYRGRTLNSNFLEQHTVHLTTIQSFIYLVTIY